MSLWDEIKKAVSKVSEAWKEYTPAGMLYKVIDKASTRHIHVANATKMPIAVIVSPNSDWIYADLATAVASLVVSFGSTAPAGLKAIKSATTLVELYQASRYYRGVAGVGTRMYNLFAEKGTTIKPGEYVDVQQRSNSNPLNYLDPSQYGALFKASDFTLMITREDGSSVIFNTNSDTSWIAFPDGCYSAKYGTIWEPHDEPHHWDA